MTRYVTLYEHGAPLTQEAYQLQLMRLIGVFPALADQEVWRDELERAVADQQWTTERLEAAVTHVIRTCRYARPAVADLLQFGVVETLRRDEYMQLRPAQQQEYTCVNLRGERRYVRHSDAAAHSLPYWSEQPAVLALPRPTARESWQPGHVLQLMEEADG